MKIYTKTGDTGETGLFGGERVKKTHPRVEAYGTLDEANSALGMAISHFPKDQSPVTQDLQTRLIRIQSEIFQIGSELASPSLTQNLILIDDSYIQKLETEIDEMEKSLPPLKNFILQGGKPAGATLHFARTLIRKSERKCIELSESISIRSEVIRYLNRLSDYLFVCARQMNNIEGSEERPWVKLKAHL